MCKFASMYVLRNGDVLCFPGVDRHRQILECAGIRDSTDRVARELAKVEITPPRRGRRTALRNWVLRVDDTQPMWWETVHMLACYAALARLIEAEAKGFETVLPDTSYVVGKRNRGVWVGLREVVRANGSWTRENWHAGKEHGRCVEVWSDGSWRSIMYRHGQQHGFEEDVAANGSWSKHLYRDGQYVRSVQCP